MLRCVDTRSPSSEAVAQRVSVKKVFFKNLQYSLENICVEDLHACNIIKKRLQHRYFPVNTVLKNICVMLPLPSSRIPLTIYYYLLWSPPLV